MSINNIIKATLLTCVLCSSANAAELVVVVSPQNSASSMTAEQVSDAFLGKSAALTPVDQAEGSGTRTEFYQKVVGKDSAQVKAIWTRLVFTGKAIPPKEVGSSADVKKLVAGDPKAIGYIEKGAVDGSVKVVFTAP